MNLVVVVEPANLDELPEEVRSFASGDRPFIKIDTDDLIRQQTTYFGGVLTEYDSQIRWKVTEVVVEID